MVEDDFTLEMTNSAKSKILKAMNESEILGLSAALIRKTGPIWIESFGYTDSSKKYKINENTLFSLQSTTKTITAIAFLLAVQKGLVNLDDPIINYYPEFKMKSFYGDEEYKKITFKHLLSHTSSIPREARIGGCFSRKLPDSNKEHIQSINDCWLQNPVGMRYKYSNIGMDLVPFILERITKKSYPEYLQQVLGEKLGIHIHWTIKEIFQQSNVAKGHLGDFEAHRMDNTAFGCGGAFVSINSHAKFVQFLLNRGIFQGETILKTEYFDMLCETRGNSGGYGLGNTINLKHGVKLFSHAGGGFGYGSEMFWLPEYDFGIAILDNNENGHFYSNYSLVQVVDEVLKEYLEKIGVDTSTTSFIPPNKDLIDLPPDKLRRLEGEFENNFFSFSIKEESGKLFYLSGGGKSELKAHDELTFTTKTPYGLFFELNQEEKVCGARLYHSEEGLLHCRYHGKPNPTVNPPPEPEWKQYTGIYYQNYYYTEYNFSTVSLDKDGYLQIFGSRLLPHKELTNIFKTTKGIVAIFEKDAFFLDNILYTRKDDVVQFYTDIVENDPKHRAAMPWIVDDVISALNELNRGKEAELMTKIKEKLFAKMK